MVLGDQATYFMTDGNQIIAIDEASGNELWRWQPTSGNVQIIAATAGGGVAVKNIVGNQEDVVRLDAKGNPTYDTWGTTGGSGGYGVVSNSTDYANGVWFGTIGDPEIAAVIGNSEQDAPSAYPDSGGNFAKQNSSGKPILKFFLPAQIATDVDISQFEKEEQQMTATHNFFDFHKGNATSVQFRKTLPTRMEVLVFIGHSVFWPAGKPLPYTGQINDVCIGVGICLTDLCLEKFPEPPDDVNWQGVAVGSIGVKPNDGQLWDTEPAPLSSDAKVIFAASCCDSPEFENWWGIYDSDPSHGGQPTPGRALILTVGTPGKNGLPADPTVNLLSAASAWETIEQALLDGETVQQAVKAGMAANPDLGGIVIRGDKSLCIGPSCKSSH